MSLEEHDMDSMGTEARRFFSSPVGQYMAQVLEEERELLRDRLERIDPRTPWGRRKWRRTREELDVLGKINEQLVLLFQVAEARMAEDEELDSRGESV